MSSPTVDNLNRRLQLIGDLLDAAQDLSAAAHRASRSRRRARHGATLRPGLGTPLWNALAAAIAPLLRPRGEKSRLARFLGVAPQRVHDYFVRRHAAPDAERTLRLMHWLALRRQGINPS
jgi:hypothetical protein